MVFIEEITYEDYKSRCASKDFTHIQSYIVGQLMGALYAQGTAILSFPFQGTELNAMDILNDFGYHNSPRTDSFITDLAKGENPLNVQIICASLGALARAAQSMVFADPTLVVAVFFVPVYSHAISTSYTSAKDAARAQVEAKYKVQAQADYEHYRNCEFKFFEMPAESLDVFAKQVSHIHQALVQLSAVFAAHPDLLRAPIHLVKQGLADCIIHPRHQTFSSAWESLNNYVNFFVHAPNSQQMNQLHVLIVLGQRETEQYLIAQHLLVQLLNKALKSSSRRETLLPVMRRIASKWSIRGQYMVDNVVNLPFDVLDTSAVKIYKEAFMGSIASIVNPIGKQISKKIVGHHQRGLNKIIAELRLSMSSELMYEENHKKFWHAVRLLQTLSPSAATAVEQAALDAGIAQ